MGLLSGISSIADSIYNIYNSERNYKNQQENQAYQRDLQEKIFGREDSSLQRRVADAEQAGLNPQLALGSGASSGAVVTSDTPQHAELNLTDAVQGALGVEKGLKELEILNQEKEKNKHENSLLALKEAIEKHDFEYYRGRNLPTNANGQYVQLLEAIGSILEGLKGNGVNPVGQVGELISGAVGTANDVGKKLSDSFEGVGQPSTHGDRPSENDVVGDDAVQELKSVWQKRKEQIKSFWDKIKPKPSKTSGLMRQGFKKRGNMWIKK